MPYTRARQDRTKAVALAVVAHLVIGAALLSGLAVRGGRVVQGPMESFDILPPSAPPPEPPPKPQPRAAAAKDAGPAAARVIPTPVVAPTPIIPSPAPNPIPASTKPTEESGSDASSGASASGDGSGAGGQGNGPGGGGSGGPGGNAGQGSGARLISGNLNRRDYRLIRSFGSPRGNAILALTIGGDGRVLNCSAFQSSGNADLDRTLCALMGRTGWAPALDPTGQPVTSAIRYVANWDRD